MDTETMNLRKGKLLFTVGMARCGKSTFCTRWAHYVEEVPEGQINSDLGMFYPRVIVCADDFRLAITGNRFNRHAEPAVWTNHTYACKALLSRGHDVIIDGTNTTEDSFWRILNIDHHADFVLIDTPIHVCKERALASGHLDLVEKGVIDRHYEQLSELKAHPGGIQGVLEKVRDRVIKRWRIENE